MQNDLTVHFSRDLFSNKMHAYAVIVLITTLFGYAAARGCPPEHLTRPCKCTFVALRETLQCENIMDRSILDGVMRRTGGFPFHEFKLINSRIDLIPSAYIHQKLFMKISIEDSQLRTFSDETSDASYSVKFLRFKNVNFSNGFPWKQLKIFPNLEQLTAVSVNIPSLGQDFKDNISKNLRLIFFNGTNTKQIDDGVFSAYSRLEGIRIQNCGLKELKRSYFPQAANIRMMRFDGNELSTLPVNIFQGMSKLGMIDFSRNKLSVISKEVFQEIPQKLAYVRLEENPLNCSCSLRWILTLASRTNVLGTCSDPARLSGKPLKSLTENDFGSCS